VQLGEKYEDRFVVGSAEMLKTQDVSPGDSSNRSRFRNCRLTSHVIDLALTVPDAHVGMGAQSGDTSPLYRRPGQRSAITIGGNRPQRHYYLLDGARIPIRPF